MEFNYKVKSIFHHNSGADYCSFSACEREVNFKIGLGVFPVALSISRLIAHIVNFA